MKKLIYSSILLLLSFSVCAAPSSTEQASTVPGSTMLIFSQDPRTTLNADCVWTQKPSVDSGATLQIQWMNAANHAAVDPAGSFDVSLFMPSMPSMYNAPTQLERVVDNQGNPVLGKYLVRNIYFMMVGRWDVRITLTGPDGSEETQQIELDI
ncbi:MAG: hypothetical protein P4M08_14465 [Oligoflexia bacterium]|nr:hypothetical protein [Oligoflexia bacterium]